MKKDIILFGIEVEVEYNYEEPDNGDYYHEPSGDCFEIIDINHEGVSIYNIVYEINNFEEKIIKELIKD